MYSEQKWEASEAKTRFAKAFPGLEWDTTQASCKTMQATFALPSNGVRLILFTDHTFRLEPLDMNDVKGLLTALREARPHLEPLYPDAFRQLDELIAHDAEIARLSKMEKLLGAIVNNSLEIPALPELVQRQLQDSSCLPAHSLAGHAKLKAERVLNAIRNLLPTTPELYEEIPKVLNGTSTLVRCDAMKSLQRKLSTAPNPRTM